MESALRVHTLNTIGRELNYGQNSTSLVQWVGSRETSWVTFMNQTLCWPKVTKLWVGNQEFRCGCKSARLKALLHLLYPTSQVFSPWSWCFRGKVAQDMAFLEPKVTIRTLLSGEGTRARAVSELTPLCTFPVPDSVMWSRWLRICLLDSEACRQRTTVFMNSTKCS